MDANTNSAVQVTLQRVAFFKGTTREEKKKVYTILKSDLKTLRESLPERARTTYVEDTWERKQDFLAPLQWVSRVSEEHFQKKLLRKSCLTLGCDVSEISLQCV